MSSKSLNSLIPGYLFLAIGTVMLLWGSVAAVDAIRDWRDLPPHCASVGVLFIMILGILGLLSVACSSIAFRLGSRLVQQNEWVQEAKETRLIVAAMVLCIPPIGTILGIYILVARHIQRRLADHNE